MSKSRLGPRATAHDRWTDAGWCAATHPVTHVWCAKPDGHQGCHLTNERGNSSHPAEWDDPTEWDEY